MTLTSAPVGLNPASGGGDPLGFISIVVPIYNEEAAIGHDLATICAAMDATGWPYEVVVVDDGSTDGSAAVAAAFPGVRLVRHSANRGVGAARTTGMRVARGDVIVTTDGDGTYPNHEMPRLLRRLVTHDMVVGARTREAGAWPWLRAPVKAALRWVAGYLCGRRIPDLNSGLRCFRRSTAERFVALLPAGHSWESTITVAYLTAGLRVAFEPVDYYPRRGGRSSFHPVRDTLRLLVRLVVQFRPRRFFLPVALALAVAAAVTATPAGWLLAGLAAAAAQMADRRARRRQRAAARSAAVERPAAVV